MIYQKGITVKSPKSRSQRPSEERHARSRAVQQIAENSMLRGSLVSMARVCGKAGCHCQQGEKHVSLYLAVRLNNRRKMIYIPPALESTVRGWVENAQDVDRLLDFISQQCLVQFLEKKQKKTGRSTVAGVHQRKPRRRSS
jgi:hypothetical protein